MLLGCASCSIPAERAEMCQRVRHERRMSRGGSHQQTAPGVSCPAIPPRFSTLCLSRFRRNFTGVDSPGARERQGTILSCPPTLNAYQLIFSFIRTKVMTNDHGIQAHNEIYFLVPDIFPGFVRQPLLISQRAFVLPNEK